ncbi:hypothetical protein H4R26_001211 [Coemansia thaxteri]|uniref:Amine oxidase domain-containing protein n=1 Tax=Coemansia thaxteri TaxID=2663907 RepID=A0A9W8BH77_9FUNG|nr:hypothetical protein H4R26_001211 [Coemansia thaxteri]
MPHPKRVAVVGSGLAGLSAAFFLQRAGVEVELFERSAEPGMDSASVDVDGHRVDVPFRVFTPDYYPCLHQLYEHLGVTTLAADNSLSFARSADRSTLWSYTNLTIGDFQLPVPDSVSDSVRVAISRDWVRLLFASALAVRTPHSLRLYGPLDVPVAEYLAAERYTEEFTAGVMLPFIAGVCTCSIGASAAYPANAVLHFMAKVAFGARLRKARGGVREVCRRLLKNQKTIHYSTPVARITSDLRVITEEDGLDGLRSSFDAVVLATPADTAACLARHVAPDLAAALDAVGYEDACVVTHRDASVMPAQQEDWRGVNISSSSGGGGGARAMATHWLNRVEDSSTSGRAFATQLFQTVDPHPRLDPSTIAAPAAGFHRSLLSVESQRALSQIHRMQGQAGLWVVGSYAAPGVPLLEGCVRSAADVAAALNAPAAFSLPTLTRSHSTPAKPSYSVGLAPGMVRGELVDAFFERDGTGTFDFARPALLPPPLFLSSSSRRLDTCSLLHAGFYCRRPPSANGYTGYHGLHHMLNRNCHPPYIQQKRTTDQPINSPF